MSKREELPEVFWKATECRQRCVKCSRPIVESGTSLGEDVVLDGHFNIWAGIQAVIAASKEVPDE